MPNHFNRPGDEVQYSPLAAIAGILAIFFSLIQLEEIVSFDESEGWKRQVYVSQPTD